MNQSSVAAVLDSIDPVPSNGDKAPAEHRRLVVRSFGLTDRGRVRPVNEDQFLIAVLAKALQVRQSSLAQPEIHYSNERGYLFAVADGMGGHAGGQQASALAIDTIERFMLDTLTQFQCCADNENYELPAELRGALGQADAKVCAEAQRHPELRGMGTTLTLAYSCQDELYAVHAGDSRCYLLRHGDLHQLTRDHTVAQEMAHMGFLSAGEVAHTQWRHVITNAVGGDEVGVKVDVHHLRLEPGDCLLLCSDGLTEMVPDEEITQLLQAEPEPRSACEKLVADANERGGKDNITVVVARYEETTA
jgi:protein phosphatase